MGNSSIIEKMSQYANLEIIELNVSSFYMGQMSTDFYFNFKR